MKQPNTEGWLLGCCRQLLPECVLHCLAQPFCVPVFDAGDGAEQDMPLLHHTAGCMVAHVVVHVGGHVTGTQQLSHCILALCDNTKQASESCMLCD